MNKSNQEKTCKNDSVIGIRALSGAIMGALVGFLAAAVIYPSLPAFVPGGISESPLACFGLLVIVCATLGYLWMLSDLLGCSAVEKRPPLFNSVISGAFTGFLISVVLYTRLVPSWIPINLAVYPVIAFIGAALLGALIGFVWNRTAV
jgi:hypothetical protein